jgi:hypothetical protein
VKHGGKTPSDADDTEVLTVSSGQLVARFIRFYGMDTWTNATWPTRDRVIPFRLFFALLAVMPGVVASEQLDDYYVAVLAGAMVHGTEEGQAHRTAMINRLVQQAHPRTRRAPAIRPLTPPEAPRV